MTSLYAFDQISSSFPEFDGSGALHIILFYQQEYNMKCKKYSQLQDHMCALKTRGNFSELSQVLEEYIQAEAEKQAALQVLQQAQDQYRMMREEYQQRKEQYLLDQEEHLKKQLFEKDTRLKQMELMMNEQQSRQAELAVERAAEKIELKRQEKRIKVQERIDRVAQCMNILHNPYQNCPNKSFAANETSGFTISMNWSSDIYPVLCDLLNTHDPSLNIPNLDSSVLNLYNLDYQNQLLGLFNGSVPLPMHRSEIDMRFVNVQRETAKRIRTILSTQPQNKKKVLLLLGVSGTGKTSSMMELATEYYTLFIQCSSYPKQFIETSTDDIDHSFYNMSSDIANRISMTPTVPPNDVAYPSILSEIILRWFFLERLLDHYKQHTSPLLFLLYQLHVVESEIFFPLARERLSNLPVHFLWMVYRQMMESIQYKMQLYQGNSRHPQFLICVDEAQTASKYNMYGSFTSVHESQLLDYDEITSDELKNDEISYSPSKRGLLGPLMQILVKSKMNILVGGTAMGLNSVTELRSDVGKRRRALETVFVMEYIQHPYSVLSQWLNIRDCLFNPMILEKEKLLCGRPRLIARTVDLVSQVYLDELEKENHTTSCEILHKAINMSLQAHRKRIMKRLKESRHFPHLYKLLCRMYVAVMLRGGKCKFIPDKRAMHDVEWDLIQLGLTGITEECIGSRMKQNAHIQYRVPLISPHYLSWTINEPFTVELLKSLVHEQSNILMEKQSADLTEQMLFALENYGRTCTEKGTILEQMVALELVKTKYHGLTLAQIPFIQHAIKQTISNSNDIPLWLQTFTWRFSNMERLPEKTSESTWIQDTKVDHLVTTLLLPSKSMGPDTYGIFMPNEHGKIATISFGEKLYTSYLVPEKRMDQESKIFNENFFKAVSNHKHVQFRNQWMQRFGKSAPDYQICVSIMLPFASQDKTLKRFEIMNETTILIRLNIRDILSIFDETSVEYKLIQYACLTTPVEIEPDAIYDDGVREIDNEPDHTMDHLDEIDTSKNMEPSEQFNMYED